MSKPSFPTALALAALTSISHAQDTLLEPVLVTTATRSEHDIATTPAPIQLIDEAEIQASGAANLREVLDVAGGVYVSPSGTNLQIRGLGHADTVYLLNGRRLKGEFSNTYELERIAASMIERIEILRGPSSLLYGADALGGVVNIITRRPAAGREVGVDVQYGANDRGDGSRAAAAVDLRGGSDDLSFMLYANALRRQPYGEMETAKVTVAQSGVQVLPSSHGNAAIRNRLQDSYAVDVEYRDQADVDTVGGTLDWRLAPGLRLGLDLNYLQEQRESNFISSRYATTVVASGKALQAANIPARQYDDNERLDVAASLDWKASENLDLRYRLHYGRYEKDRVVYALPWADLGYASQAASASSINKSTLEHLVHELGGVWRAAAGHTLVGGLEHRSNETESTAYAADTRNFRSAFLQHEWQFLPQVNLVYGLRHDDDSVGGSQLSGQAGAVWRLAPLLRLRANYAQGFKAPDDRSLYVNQVNPSGVPMLGAEVIEPDKGKTSAHALRPESSETVELGLAGDARGWHYAITAFHTTIDDRIEQVREGSGSLTYNTFRNISQARIRGLESEATIPLAAGLRARLAATVLNAESRESGERLLNTPERLASVGLDYAPAEHWMLQAIVRHTGDQDYSGTDGTERAAAYTLLHLKASYLPPSAKGLEIYGGINNVLDEEVDTALGSDPGPYLYVGMRYRF